MDKRALQSAPYHLRFMMLNRSHKKLIMLLVDLIALPVALWSGYALRLAEWWPEEFLIPAWPLFVLTPIVGALIFTKLGLYRAVVRFMGAQAILAVVKGVMLLAVTLWISAVLLEIEPFPRSVPINFALAAFIYVGGSRLLVRNYYHWLLKNFVQKKAVLIYGAGGAGVQLAAALNNGKEFVPLGFIDDDQNLNNSTVAGLPVFSKDDLSEVLDSLEISHVLLAMPSIQSERRKKILESLSLYPVHVKTVPSMPDIVSGDSVDDLREIDLEDLLGREPVTPNESLMSFCIQDKAVLVTGAGGSIGSELCRQIIRSKPKLVVLYELSEFALYTIEQELTKYLQNNGLQFKIYPVLGSVLDQDRINRVISSFNINTIYHAAAFKHVPLVEHNVFEGIKNNAFGTRALARAALEYKVDHFVLISTDKAVRPTNVMGATKRLAELVLQDLAETNPHTVYSMVRFGNVLGSSGSVVPLFRKQIESGGPVTVTHPEITRYFMTIPEAASLVIQAGSMAKGGDVFVLDMGEPVKIVDLALKMIHLMGMDVKSPENVHGIELEYSGLRPGEKLYEELLISADVIGTEHPKIMRAHEEKLTSKQLNEVLSKLEHLHALGDSKGARAILKEGISGYVPSSELVDWLADEKQLYSSNNLQ